LWQQELKTQIESYQPEVALLKWQAAADNNADSSRVNSAVRRFEDIRALVDVWQTELQVALVQCQDFHCTVDNLHDWLSRIDVELNAVEPVNLGVGKSRLRKVRSHLKVFANCQCVCMSVLRAVFFSDGFSSLRFMFCGHSVTDCFERCSFGISCGFFNQTKNKNA